jgi:hypothetical protein
MISRVSSRRWLIATTGMLAVMAAGSAAAQEIRPSEPVPIDSMDFVAAPADTIPLLAPRFREAGGPEELSEVPSVDALPKNPRNAAIRAFLLPGWGQVYAGHPWRAVLFASAEIGFFALGYSKQREALDRKSDLRAAREEFFATQPDSVLADSLAAEEAFELTPEAVAIRGDIQEIEERREDFYAYFAASIIFAAIDAYVSAQLDPVTLDIDPATGRIRAGVEFPIGRRRSTSGKR